MPRHRSLRSRLRSRRERVQRQLGKMERRHLVLLGAIAAGTIWLGWTILALGLSDARANRVPEAALDWHAGNTEALIRRAEEGFTRAATDEDIQMVKRDALAAAIAAPLDVRAISLLGRIAEKEGDAAQARRLMELAGQRDLRHWPTQVWLINELFKEGERKDVLYRSDALLKAHPQARGALLPLLMTYASEPELRPVLLDTLVQEPSWREWFLGEVSRQKSDIAESLFSDLSSTEAPPTLRERRAHLQALVRQGDVVKAYLGWVQTLPIEEQGRIGTPYNGDFEKAPSGVPFDWTIERVAGAATEIRPSTAGNALLVEFVHQRVAYRHVYEVILLGPGRYRLSGKAKSEAIENPQGLVWRVYCAGQSLPLVETEKFKGTFAWREFETTFEVPEEGCRAQVLRLEIATRIVLDQTIGGRIWFDDLVVQRLPDQTG